MSVQSLPSPSSATTDVWATALAEMGTAVLLIDAKGRLGFANAAAEALLGRRLEPGRDLYELLAACGVDGAPPLGGIETGASVRLGLADGRIAKLVGRALRDGSSVLTLDDVSGFVRDAELARSDPLTGLANRTGFHAGLSALLRSEGSLALFCLDLDRFKAINDTLGHPLGDALLRRVAERLKTVAGDNDILARLGGDEFALVVPGIAAEQAQAFAARLVDLVGRTYAISGHLMNIGCSVGVALYPEDGADGDLLIRNADLALYRAKAEGRGTFRFFEAEMDARMQRRRALEIDLRRALAFKEFELVYQPQVQLETHDVVGFEALLRWNSARRGLVSPAEFIPLAEEIGLIVSIGAWVLRTACEEAASWTKPVAVAVNLSPVQFRTAGLIETVATALAHSGLDPRRLELEITEGALLEDTDAVIATLMQIRALGVRVSMDDFGTGYSSLSYLQKFPFDKIKIDQIFVRDMCSNADCSAIVRAVAGLGASLGMKTTAEGVETQEQLDAIRAEGCTEVQGYLTGRPLSAAAAATLLNPNTTAQEGA